MDFDSSGQRLPFWSTEAQPGFSVALDRDLTVDVCVIGGGITGLTTAYYALQEGRTVALLEDGQIGSGETGRTSGHLASALDDRFIALEELHGQRGARLAAESHAYAIDEIEKISRENGIICDFRRVPGYLFRASEADTDLLAREFDAARRAGLEVSWSDRAPFTNFDTGRCLVFANQAEFHPIRYLRGLADAVRGNGGLIFTSSHAKAVDGGSPAYVTTSSGRTVTAGAVVIATNSPITDLLSTHTRQTGYRSFVIAATIGKRVVPHGLYWDTGDPYHYIRLAENPHEVNTETVIIGGGDEKTGQSESSDRPFEALEAWARERLPSLGPVRFRWSGQILEPVDGLAFIGPDPSGQENVYIHTGDSGNGLTHGTLGARLIVDLIEGRENPWAPLYDPSRKSLGSIRDLMTENLNAVGQYADWVTGSDVDSLAALRPGQGAVIRQGLRKLAVYRDEHGRLHQHSAVCPHLHALVRWNDVEKTWDCPAHGSRFAPDGRVVNGPANRDLSSVEKDVKSKS